MTTMKTNYIIIFLILISTSCETNTKNNTKNTIITSIDSTYYKLKLTRNIGEFVFPLPKNTDTIYSWTSTTDYSCGTKINTRFANKKYTLNKETGMFPSCKNDSLKQITISWLKNSNCSKFDFTYFKSVNLGKNKSLSISGCPAYINRYIGQTQTNLPIVILSTYIQIDSNTVSIIGEFSGNNYFDIENDYFELINNLKINK